ncbi:MAG: hypothetical protein CVU44_22080 [Chloroflexi bacterium HGW-Chloroflexi-6]|nr:MAG: hypothetical protein CVU44_22080 [Chloroflexi bacterium HGW-Chloroflexi-6]
MAEPRLHLDADTSKKSLLQALVEKGHDVTRTPNEWMVLDADDIQQLLGATAQGRVIFTFNVRDFMELAKRYPHHSGVLLSAQKSMPELLPALEKMFANTEADEWVGQVRWLNDWMK